MDCSSIENRKFVMNDDFDIETAKYFRHATHKSKLDAAFGVA